MSCCEWVLARHLVVAAGSRRRWLVSTRVAESRGCGVEGTVVVSSSPVATYGRSKERERGGWGFYCAPPKSGVEIFQM